MYLGDWRTYSISLGAGLENGVSHLVGTHDRVARAYGGWKVDAELNRANIDMCADGNVLSTKYLDGPVRHVVRTEECRQETPGVRRI